MTTLDNFRLPLAAGFRVYLEVLEAHFQSAATMMEPPVVARRMVPGKVCLDGMTAVFDTADGPLVKHLTCCYVCQNTLRLR